MTVIISTFAPIVLTLFGLLALIVVGMMIHEFFRPYCFRCQKRHFRGQLVECHGTKVCESCSNIMEYYWEQQ